MDRPGGDNLRQFSDCRLVENTQTVPFDSVEDAWFWFISAMQARNDGARFSGGEAILPRPCEPADILKVMDRLYRTRRLLIDHFKVLRHYGRRMLPPDPYRVRERRAHTLWQEAMARLEPVLVHKGIVSAFPRCYEAAE